MRIGAHASREDGFTLVELMVVLLIVGLMVSVIAFRPGAGPDMDERHAREVARMLNMLARESIVSGHPTGLDITEHSYAMMRWKEGNWEPLSFRRHRVPEDRPDGVSLAHMSGNEKPVGASSSPEIIFLPVGEATPYRLEYSTKEGAPWRVEVGAGAQVQVESAAPS